MRRRITSFYSNKLTSVSQVRNDLTDTISVVIKICFYYSNIITVDELKFYPVISLFKTIIIGSLKEMGAVSKSIFVEWFKVIKSKLKVDLIKSLYMFQETFSITCRSAIN
ncbi:hypothetical protein RclHR1_03090003 [Rhizophagus clarus]|uniref:Uncharacterized protein n=1 Tax=Rhizophagus clarus TaxID=94130 RepID=A0A2Z6R6P9_9GLOM|nr:hypothetical protein RclHR1_03090003 [Rhizophagus clarus]